MDKFNTLTSVAAPLPLINVDTDMIIPARFLKTIKRTGLGADLFSTLRFQEDGSELTPIFLKTESTKKISSQAGSFNCFQKASRNYHICINIYQR